MTVHHMTHDITSHDITPHYITTHCSTTLHYAHAYNIYTYPCMHEFMHIITYILASMYPSIHRTIRPSTHACMLTLHLSCIIDSSCSSHCVALKYATRDTHYAKLLFMACHHVALDLAYNVALRYLT